MLAWNDERGRGLNARTVRKLYPGRYGESVRHKGATGSGRDTVEVKQRR